MTTPPVNDVFSQLAAQQSQQNAAPAAIPQPATAPAQPAQASTSGQGDIFDQLASGAPAQAASSGTSAPQQPSTPVPDALHMDDNMGITDADGQAIGQDNADALMQHVDAAMVQAGKIADNQQWAKTLVKYGLPGYASYEAIHAGLNMLTGK